MKVKQFSSILLAMALAGATALSGFVGCSGIERGSCRFERGCTGRVHPGSRR